MPPSPSRPMLPSSYRTMSTTSTHTIRQQRSKSDCLPPKSSRIVSGSSRAAKWLVRKTSWGLDSDTDSDEELWGTSFEQWPDDLDPKNDVKGQEVHESVPNLAQGKPEAGSYLTMSDVTLEDLWSPTVSQTDSPPDSKASTPSPRQSGEAKKSGLISTMNGVTFDGVRPHTIQGGQPFKNQPAGPSPLRRQFASHTWHPSSGDTRLNNNQADTPLNLRPESFRNGAKRSGHSRPKLSDIWPEYHKTISGSLAGAPL